MFEFKNFKKESTRAQNGCNPRARRSKAVLFLEHNESTKSTDLGFSGGIDGLLINLGENKERKVT